MELLPAFRMHRPASIEEAVTLLAADPAARPVAGGTDLLPNLRRGLGVPSALVDLTAVRDFSAISEGPDGALRIGAGVRLAALIDDPRVAVRWPVIAEAAVTVAGPTHRSAATLGGNLCQDTRCMFYNQSEWWRAGNDYCMKYDGDRCHVVVKSDRCYATYRGDVAPALIALDAQAELIGPQGLRRLKLAQLFKEDGAAHLTLGPGEVLAAVIVPPADGWRVGYEKVRIRDSVDFPLLGVAAAVQRDGETLAGLRIAITGCNSAPFLAPVDDFLGKPWNGETADGLTTAVRKSADFLRTTAVGARYRRRVLQAVTRRLIDRLWDER